MADNTNGNPWKGLNFYVEGEILYGRDVEILSLSQYIFNNTQIVLYGRSGIGKSSILNAGIFPKARLSGMIPVGIRLKHDDAGGYLPQIRAAIAGSGLTLDPVVPAVDGEENETLWEFMHRHNFLNEKGERCVPLFVFDQFEEIFTLQKDERRKRDFFKQLGDLFNDVKPAYIVEHESRNRKEMLDSHKESGGKVVSSGTFKGLNLRLNLRHSDADRDAPRYIERPDYHIVFALREDFLSSLELYAATIPVMKDNRFGLLPINEEQAADIIRRPRPGLVDDEVTALIIRQVTGRNDFILDGIPEIEVDAAVLSLFLSRLYSKKNPADTCISAELVNNYSGHIINDFYVESVASDLENGETVTEESVLLLEDQLLTREGRRNNVSRSDLVASGVSESELDILIYARKLLRQFHHGNDIRIEYIHDILCPVVKERREQRELLRQQQIERRRQEEEKERIIREAEEHAKRVKLRNRRILIWAASILAMILIGGAYYWHEKIYLPNKEHVKYYSQFELVNGWPVGINELSDDERQHTPLYYRLSHIGEGVNDTDVEICSSNSMLPADVRITNWPELCKSEADGKGNEFNDVLRKVKRIHFVAGENGKVEKMELRDEHDHPMMLMSYFHLNDSEAWIHYMTTKGQSMNIRDNGIDRVKLSWDSLGRIEYLRYYTSAGVAKPIQQTNDIGGFYRNYPADSPGTIEYYTLNTYGLPVTDATYNMKRVTTGGDSVITSYHKVGSVHDDNPLEAVGDEGYSRIEYAKSASGPSIEQLYIPGKEQPVAVCTTEYDDHGNSTRQTIEGMAAGNLPPLIKWSYKDDTGLILEKEYLTADGRPYGNKDDDVCLWKYEYDSEGSRVSERRLSPAGKVLYSYDRTETESGGIRIVTDTEEDYAASRFYTVIDSTTPGRHAVSFWGKDRRKINRPVLFMEEDSVLCHYYVADTVGNVTVRRFYAADADGAVFPVKTHIDPDSYRVTAFCIKEVSDAAGNRERMEITDSDGNIIKRMMYFLQNGKPVGRAVWGVDDRPVRCPDWEEEGFGYYVLYFTKDFDNSYVNLQTFDEWKNNSVFQLTADNYATVRPLELRGKNVWLDRDNNSWVQIPSTKSVTVAQFNKSKDISGLSMPFMHILSKDCILYQLGLRDGDRVVKLGGWSLGESESKFRDEWGRLNKTPVDIELLRPVDSGLEKKVYHIPVNPQGKVASECHFMKLSDDEKTYYENHVL